MNKNRVSIMWPTYIGEFYNPNHLEIKKPLLDFFTQYKNLNKNSRSGGTVLSPTDKSSEDKYEINDDVYMSKYDLHLQKNESYQKLMKFTSDAIMAIVTQATKTELKSLDFEEKNLTTLIKESWFIDYKKGGFVLPHTHPQCSWNCVYYVQLGDDVSAINGSTFFQKTRPPSQTNDFGSEYNTNTMLKIKPIEGKLLVWPQFVMHGSTPYYARLKSPNRIIVSVNALVTNKKIN
jgi:uncharacterized protein (TIGR02466 family)